MPRLMMWVLASSSYLPSYSVPCCDYQTLRVTVRKAATSVTRRLRDQHGN